MVKIEAFKSDNGKVYFTEAEAINADKNKVMYKKISELANNYTTDTQLADSVNDFILDNPVELFAILKERYEECSK